MQKAAPKSGLRCVALRCGVESCEAGRCGTIPAPAEWRCQAKAPT
jgi:hypothetical protein